MTERQWIDTAELAERTGIGVSTIKRWRALGEGPPWYKVAGRVVYDWLEVDAWIRSQRFGVEAP